MRVKYGYKTDIGEYRKNNQDYLGFDQNPSGQYLAIICDGMGGHKYGEVASKMAVENLIKHFNRTDFSKYSDKQVNFWFRNTIIKIQEKMFKYAQDNPETMDMGTTMVACLIANDKVFVLNIGDSRLYKLHYDELYQITSDQNIWNDKNYRSLQENQLKAKYAKTYSNTFWKVLTSALGPNKTLKIDTYVIQNTDGTYILTTDGVHDYVDEYDFIEILESKNKLNEKAKMLINRALNNMSTDNLTALIFEIEQNK